MLNIASVAGYKTTNKILRNLQHGNEVLGRELNLYTPISGDFYTAALYETLPTPMPMGGDQIV
jgi:hypothetical protein